MLLPDEMLLLYKNKDPGLNTVKVIPLSNSQKVVHYTFCLWHFIKYFALWLLKY